MDVNLLEEWRMEALTEWSLKQVADMQAATSQVQKGDSTAKEAMEVNKNNNKKQR